jgi:predicted HTH domain antitoxin
MGQAKRLAGLDQIAFQHEMAKRDVCLNYDVDEFRKDLETLELLEGKLKHDRS